MSAPAGDKVRRLVAPAALIAAGFASGMWLLRDPAPPTDVPAPAETPMPDAEAPAVRAPAPAARTGDPAVRHRNIPEVIRRFEDRIADLRRENERHDQVIVSYQRAPDYRLSASEVDDRGRRVLMLTRQKHANQQLIEDLERRVRELKQEYEQFRAAHDGE